MKTSTNIDKIIPALIKVKSKLKGVAKTSDNPYFKSKYADLNSYIEAVEDLLAENDLILLQPTGIDDQGTFVETSIVHTSGQFISASMRLVLKTQDMQQAGAAVTYGRRFTLGSLLSMKAEDDDGNLASGKETKPAAKSFTPKSAEAKIEFVSAVGKASETIVAKPTEAKPSAGFTKPTKKAEATTEKLVIPAATIAVPSKGAWS